MENIQFSKENPFGFLKKKQQVIGINDTNRFRHTYISGLKNKAKEELFQNMIVGDINREKGVFLIDPTGEVVDSVIKKIQTNRDDIHILDASNIKKPFSINLLEVYSTHPFQQEMERVMIGEFCVQFITQTFLQRNDQPLVQDFLYKSCQAVFEGVEQPHLVDLFQFITNFTFQGTITKQLTTAPLVDYWNNEFTELEKSDSSFSTTLRLLTDRMKDFMTGGSISKHLFQSHSSLDIHDVLNKGEVVLCRLSRYDIGIEQTKLLGSMLLFKSQQSLFQRYQQKPEERMPTYLHEFHHFTQTLEGSKSLAELLSEVRRYHVGLILHHEFIDDILKEQRPFLATAVFNNCGTLVSFKTSPYNASFLESFYYDEESNQGYQKEDFLQLKEDEFIGITVKENGVSTRPFVANTLPLPFTKLDGEEINKLIGYFDKKE